ncbi:MAG: hypothetical protein HGB05_12845 [Chloroflexi bacterium]|nr:hypothetical protein [Chloroflexota bacterium]
MTDNTNPKLRLKKATGWFPAGDGFLKAITILPDGPFKLFVFLFFFVVKSFLLPHRWHPPILPHNQADALGGSSKYPPSARPPAPCSTLFSPG